MIQSKAIKFIDSITWINVVMICLTLGLAPFNPPHVWEKLIMLTKGELVRIIDWFDLVMHGAPWIVMFLKLIIFVRYKARQTKP